MPTNEQLLIGAASIANSWKTVAVFWHIYFGVMVILFLSGIPPRQRIVGLLLGPPLLSVSIIARVSSDPFNGGVFAFL